MKKTGIALLAALTILLPSCKHIPVSVKPVESANESTPSPTLLPTPFFKTADPTPAPTPGYEEYGFVSVADAVKPVIVDARYYSDYNFTGGRVDGYNAPKVLLTIQAAQALQKAADALAAKGYILKVYDGYRPKQAVAEFINWAEDPEAQEMKDTFYPNVDKKDLFKLGYIATNSAHTRGSTADLTIVRADTSEDVDMGSPFDFMDPISWFDSTAVTPEQKQNRTLLRQTMVDCGFEPISHEWWHFTLKNEPYPDTYFDFPVE